MGSPLRLSLWRDRVEAERRRTGEDKETRNAGEKPVHGFMGSLLNPKAVALVLVY
jgi:threonine/homoserine/homoserine lactone efflux protein